MEEQRRYSRNHENDDQDEEWSDESESESYYSDSDSSVPEWESSVDDNTGELLFINCHPFVTQNNIDNKTSKENLEPFSKNQLRRSTRGKFLRLIRRRESKRHSRRYTKSHDLDASTSNKVKFHDSQEGEEKEVMLKITSTRKPSAGASMSETLLGISTGTLSDGNRVMISGFLPDSEAKHEKNIKIGDWLKSINNIEVNFTNLNSVLDKVCNKTEVLLKLQRVAGVEVTKDPPINELNYQSRFVRDLIDFTHDQQPLLDIFCQRAIGALYINTDKLAEGSPEYDDVIYCYPRPLQQVPLCQSRGMFITLEHLLLDITKTKAKVTSFLVKNELAHVVYTSSGAKLFLLMIPDCCATVKEALMINNALIRMIEFTYGDLDRCYSLDLNKIQIDHFFARFFTKLLNHDWTSIDNFLETNGNCLGNIRIEFENILEAAPSLKLPSEAHMQIEDALTELEASDYREWNEEPLDCQRLFTILGSALYHYGYLLASHLIYEDLIDVHNYCYLQGYLHLSRTEPVKNLVMWKEVHPRSCDKQRNPSIKIPDGRRYLLLVGSAKDLLAVVMEAGGCTEPSEDNMGPDAFYVEEAQATLAHIQELGLPELADRWIAMNPGPQVTVPDVHGKRRSDFIDSLNRSLPHLGKDQKRPEVTSILKRRNSEQNFINHATSAYSLAEESYEGQSEDSGSQGGQSEISEESGVRSRRSARYDSNDEESDNDDYGDGSQVSNCSFDMSELRQTLLSETEDILPQQLTAGNDNVLFHFLQFDSTEGILVCPSECRLQSQTLEVILNNFRKCCHKIHSLFQNTLRFKNMPAQDMAKSVMNKSLIAIKEHGVMFECPFLDDSDTKKFQIKYWVVGRLFYMPHAREVYVCYQDSIPQNIIELAFKIELNV